MKIERKRGFEVISAYHDKGINIPVRATHKAAGYDLESAEDIILPTFWKQIFRFVLTELKQWIFSSPKKEDLGELPLIERILKPTLVPTGLKAYMQDDEYMQIVNRSSNPLKRFLALPNGIGIVDADYYNNESNEGHLYVQLINFGLVDQVITKGDRIAQGIFSPYLIVDGDQGGTSERSGGFGSSDK
ncbi:dUTP diphosphatase [Fundicoccus sp. Sow4_D5]|uniref:dUTP diphosphatase n=1 Tax=unclassified Fundicoccus TaxID=2761543 RepID=UPI003F912740